jgi:hypothetical protein
MKLWSLIFNTKILCSQLLIYNSHVDVAWYECYVIYHKIFLCLSPPISPQAAKR